MAGIVPVQFRPCYGAILWRENAVIPKSDTYCAIRDGVVMARGSKKAMLSLVNDKQRARESGWKVGLGFGPVGTSIMTVVVDPFRALASEGV